MGDVRIVEVGPRDGLQNESRPIALAHKRALVEALAAAGVFHIETGSFVSPKWVPQMADSAELFSSISRQAGVRYTALTPNLKGAEAALSSSADEFAIFAAASESFSQKNINCSIAQSIERFQPVMSLAREHRIPVRAYVSCIIACPYDGPTAPEDVLNVCEQLLQLGCYEISLGDTIGVGTPGSMRALLRALLKNIPPEKLAMHCHDTYGQALANCLTALDLGLRTFDASVAGLGGCPYAPGASGNLATDDLVYMLEGCGMKTGIDLDALVQAGEQICTAMNRPNASKVALARRALKKKSQ